MKSINSKLETLLWEKYHKKTIFICFLAIGVTSSFPFVIMLAAAHDFLKEDNNHSTNSTSKHDCNPLSTGAVLLADIIPGFIIRIIIPLFFNNIKYNHRVMFVVITSIVCFLLVSLAPSELKFFVFLGIVCGSMSAGVAEITFLSFSTLYPINLSFIPFISGSSFSSLFSTFIYAGLTSIGFNYKTVLFSMLFVPVLLAISFILLPTVEFVQTIYKTELIETDNTDRIENKPLSEKFKVVRSLLKFMIPLFLVYYSDYLINQGLFELIYFKDNKLIPDHGLQYRWYNVVFRLGVFIARSTVKFIEIKFLPIFAIFQILNLIIMSLQVYFSFMDSIILVLLIILWEGLIGGACYGNAFKQISNETSKETKEFCMAITTVADCFGIALAGSTAILIHAKVCGWDN